MGDIERLIRSIKDRCRASWNTLPYRLCQILVDWLIRAVVYAIGGIPKRSATDARSARERLSGRVFTGRDVKFVFGAYVQVHPEETFNDMTERTRPAIALMPTGNLMGSWVFLCTDTFETVTRQTATALPIPETVVELLNRRADRDFGLGKRRLKVGSWKTAYVDFDDESESNPRAEKELLMELAPGQVERVSEGAGSEYADEVDEDDTHSEQSDDTTATWYDPSELRAMTPSDIPEWDDLSDDEDADHGEPARQPSPGVGDPYLPGVEEHVLPGVENEGFPGVGDKRPTGVEGQPNERGDGGTYEGRLRPTSKIKAKAMAAALDTALPFSPRIQGDQQRKDRARSHTRSFRLTRLASEAKATLKSVLGYTVRPGRHGVFHLTVKKALSLLGVRASTLDR